MRITRTRTLLAVLALLATMGCTGDEEQPDVEAGEGDGEQAAEADFSGETLTIVVPFGPGGSADLLARLLSDQMPQHIPGEPRIDVENMPGGGGAIGAAEVLQRRDADGNTMLMTTSGMLMRALLGEEGHDYPLDEMHALGGFQTGLATVARDDRVQGFDDLLDDGEPIAWGAQSPSSSGGLFDQLVAQMLDMSVDHIFGFEGEGETAIAVERGEVDMATPTLAAYGGTYLELEGVSPIFQSGILDGDDVVRAPELEDVPTFAEAYEEALGEDPSENELWDAVIAFLQSQSLQQTTFLHPDTPMDRVETLGDAFRDTVESQEYQEAAIEVLGEDQPGVGPDQARELLDQFANTPDDIVAQLQEIALED